MELLAAWSTNDIAESKHNIPCGRTGAADFFLFNGDAGRSSASASSCPASSSVSTEATFLSPARGTAALAAALVLPRGVACVWSALGIEEPDVKTVHGVPRTLGRAASFFFSGVFSLICDEIDLWMSPIAVFCPVNTTTAVPLPFTTVVPCERSWG